MSPDAIAPISNATAGGAQTFLRMTDLRIRFEHGQALRISRKAPRHKLVKRIES
jgi:hypothetical protein